MKRSLVILACALVAANAAAHGAPQSGTLRWTDGEAMPGDIVEATGTSATWKSPLFEEPVVLDWKVIHRMDWPATDAAAPGDPFMISLRDGSNLFGDVTAITGSSVFIHSGRCGDAELKRAEVLNARRIQGNALILAGPTGGAGWQEVEFEQGGKPLRKSPGDGDGARVAGFAGGPGGTLQMPYWNRAATMDLRATEDPLNVEFRVHSSARPNFRLSIQGAPGAGLNIETWADALVAALPDERDFTLIRKLDDSDREIALRFCWDPKSRHCMVFTPPGETVADWQAPRDDTSFQSGLLIQNKGADLSLDYLRIRKWDGKPPQKFDPGKPRVELADGRILPAAVISGSAGSIQLSGSAAESGTVVALADVDTLVFSTDSPGDNRSGVTLAYADGTYLNGHISGIRNGSVNLETSFSVRPLVANVAGLGQLFVNGSPNVAPAQAEAKLDRLQIQQTILHGTLASADDASPRWLPLGAAAPVTPSKTIPYEIERYFPEDAPVQTAPALFYTRTQDVLPGTMHAMNRDGVEFDSPIAQATRLSAANLEAIQFCAPGRVTSQGFVNAGWRILKGDPSKVVRTGTSLEMQPGTSIGNPAAMQSSEIRFHLKMGESLSALRLRLFCALSAPEKAMNLLFGANGNMLESGLEGMNGQFDTQIQAVPPSDSVAVRLVIGESSVDLYLNGLCVQRFPSPPAGRAGAGLIIEPAGIWGNSPQPVKITDFSMASVPGSTALQDVAADARMQALTIPRFRRDDPPTHALIAGNGDVLRGEVEAVTTQNFGFRSGLEELVVPRDRVKAVIMMVKPPPGAKPSPPPEQSPTEKLLAETINSRIMFGQTSLRNLISWLQNQYPALKIKLPDDPKAEKPSGNVRLSIGGQSIAAALDKICSVYGFAYRIDDKGAVVLEPGSRASGEMVDRIYWLKEGSLPADSPADKVLAAKGVSFPSGASARWLADAGQLTVRNTPDNQTRLAQLLASDFGGTAHSPSHWIILSSGARLGLAVDKFGKDAITGWHPLYGHCSIPTADVAAIRSYPLEPSATIKSVEDWHMVYAAEPVLPEAGGESFASIGKPAAPFSLALLDGGKFDLARQKGKIVVLDFWATWCGPCVHSLPGLIQTMSGFSPDRVKFVGINEGEPAGQIKQFLDTRGWKLTVAMDDGNHVGQKYGVDGIPHTVVISPDGKVAWVKTGYTPGGEADAAKEVSQLLADPSGSASH